MEIGIFFSSKFLQNQKMKNNIASVWQRILSHFIDLFIAFLLPLYFLNLISNTTDVQTFLDSSSIGVVFIFFAYPVIYAAFISFMVSNFGGTLGKLLTGTKIVNSNGENISFWRAFFRNHIGYMISGVFLWLGFVWVFIDKERRTWHDQIADTFVITTNKFVAIFGVIFLIIVIFIELSLITKSVVNFSDNGKVYTDIINTVNDSLPKDTPTPNPPIEG